MYDVAAADDELRFTAEVERSLRVLDGAIAVYCGVAGVQAQSETVWRQANTYQVPRIAYVNKLDRAGANFYDVVTDISERLEGLRPIAVQVPIGEEKGFEGVVDLVTMKAYRWNDEVPPPPPEVGEVPADVLEEAQLYRSEMIERLAEVDGEIEELFLEEATPSVEQLRAALRRVTVARKGMPVLCGASFKHKGAQPLLDAICQYLPSPEDRPPIEGRKPKGKRVKAGDDLEDWQVDERPPTLKAPFAAYAFKTVSTKTSDVVYLRVYSGEADKSKQLLSLPKGKKERLGGGIYLLEANRKQPLEGAKVGDIVGVVGLRYTTTGDTLCDPSHPIALGRITFPLPVVTRAVEPKSTADRDDLWAALKSMAKDDPTFTVTVDDETGQTVISGMGELHLEIVEERLKRDWKLEVKVGKPRVSYKQTVVGEGRADGSYEMQQGERRVFGRVVLEVKPREKAPGGLVVTFAAPEAQVPEAMHEAVEEALRSRATSVGDWGDPLIDAEVRVVGGEWVEDESNEAAFSAAASRALESALEKAGLVSLEPVMTLVVETPEDSFGAVIQDLQARRAEVVSTTMVRDRHRIVAAVPLAKVFGYAGDVRSKTQGRADFAMEPRDYAQVPDGERPKLF